MLLGNLSHMVVLFKLFSIALPQRRLQVWGQYWVHIIKEKNLLVSKMLQ